MALVPATSRGLPSSGGQLTGTLDVAANAGATVAGAALAVEAQSNTFDVAQFTAGNGTLVAEFFQTVGVAGGVQINSYVNANPVLFLDHEGGAPAADILSVTVGGVTRSRFDKSGYFMTRRNAAPADADLATSELALWFDNTVGAAKLMVKAKNSAGTVVTGSLALA